MDEMIRKAATRRLLLLPLLAGCGQALAWMRFPRSPRPSWRRPSPQRIPCPSPGSPRSPRAVEVLLGVLNARERDALARGYLRFRSPVPLEVDVAAPSARSHSGSRTRDSSPPGVTLDNDDARWTVFRKTFDRGWVGLGVNGLDGRPRLTTSPSSVPRRLPPRSGSKTSCSPGATLDDWSLVPVRPGVSAAREVHRPFAAIPGEWDGSLLLRPSHDRRHSTLLASGRVWKTHVPSGARPDQVTIAYGSDPARELVWTWRTGRGDPGQPDPDRPRPVRVGRDWPAPRPRPHADAAGEGPIRAGPMSRPAERSRGPPSFGRGRRPDARHDVPLLAG